MSELKANGQTSLLTELSSVFIYLPGMVPGIQKVIVTYTHLQMPEGNFDLGLRDVPCSMVCYGQFLFTCCHYDDNCIRAFNMEREFELVKCIIVSDKKSQSSLAAVTIFEGFVIVADQVGPRGLIFDANKPPAEWTFSTIDFPPHLDGLITDIAATHGIICIANNYGIVLFNAAIASDRSDLVLTHKTTIRTDRVYSCGVFANPQITPKGFVIKFSVDSRNWLLQEMNISDNKSQDCITLHDNVSLDTISISCGRLYVSIVRSLFVFDIETGELMDSIVSVPDTAQRVTVTDDGSWLLYFCREPFGPKLYSQRVQNERVK